MLIKKIENKKIWEDFCLRARNKTFLQSFNWGEFNKKMGDKVWRFGVYSKDELIAVFQIVKISARRGSFLFLPHGPVLIKNKEKVFKEVLKKMKELAKEEKVLFIRISPILERNEKNKDLFDSLEFHTAPIHMHPELTWELDITPSEDDLLREMRKTTRYLIRQGIKTEGLEIIQTVDKKDLKSFNNVYKITADRHNFTPFSKKYLENELEAFKDDNEVVVFLGKYNGEVIASSMIIFWSGIAFYHQGASSQKYPKVPASYLMQWEAIKEAKKRGCRTYNFWGIAPENQIKNKNHPWAGLTLFKKGFGGQKKEYVKTQDYPISMKYWLTFAFEYFRKLKRNL